MGANLVSKSRRLFFLLGCLVPLMVAAQSYPSKPIRISIPGRRAVRLTPLPAPFSRRWVRSSGNRW